MKTAELELGACPLHALAQAIGGKWKISIMGNLFFHGPMRTSQLRRAVGSVSEKVLTDQLRALMADDLVERRDYKKVPPHVDYRLTPRGQELSQLLAPLAAWSADNLTTHPS